MIDKKTESDIKAVKGFLEFWVKFHSIYESTISKELITKEDEKKFLESKNLIGEKYEALKKGLEFNYMPHMRLTDPVSDILAVTGICFISEKNLKKLNDNWNDSYVFLNSILERLGSKKRRLEPFSPVGVFIKRIFERKDSLEL
jgi:hypothetical protein